MKKSCCCCCSHVSHSNDMAVVLAFAVDSLHSRWSSVSELFSCNDYQRSSSSSEDRRSHAVDYDLVVARK